MLDNNNDNYAVLAGKRVLLCEDNALNAEIVVRFLSFKSCKCEIAADGETALNKFLEAEPGYYDAILMDIRMPVKDGLQVAREMRDSEHPSAKTIPIIATSASFFDNELNEAYKAGMNICLQKPIESETLYKTLVKYTAG